MAGYGMMMGSAGMGLFGLLYIIIATFIVSAIFWKTYTWIVKGKKLL